MNYEEFKLNLVRVNSGSGVLVPAMSEEYCYVLTAKHNIVKAGNTIIDIKGVSFDISDEDIFSSDTLDASVVLLRGLVSPPLALSNIDLEHGENITLGGFPSLWEGKPTRDRYLDGKIKDVRNPEFDILCEEFPIQDEIMGMSGGGVFLKLPYEWALVGIEFEMAGSDDEGGPQIHCYNLEVFEKIVSDNSLPLLMPAFFTNFEVLCDSSFVLEGTFFDEEKKKFLSSLLRAFSRSRLSKKAVSPQVLWDQLKEKIFVKNTPSHCVSHKNLWIAWLELLMISLLMDEKDAEHLDMEYIHNLSRNRRLLYSNSTADWSTFIKDIVATKMDGLENNSVLFIANNCNQPPNKAIVNFQSLPTDIARISSADFDFTKSKQQPKPDWIVHLSGLHWKSINDKEQEYECIDPAQTIEKIREEYVKNIAGG